MDILKRGKYLLSFALVLLLCLVSGIKNCCAQPLVSASDPSNSIGYTSANDPALLVANALSEAAQFDAAERILTRKLETSGDNAQRIIQLSNQLVLIKARHLLASGEANAQYAATVEKISKAAGAVAAKTESQFKSDQVVPSSVDLKLFLEFGKYRALSELARYLTAAKLATVGNKTLDTAALKAINDEIELLDALQGKAETRVSELTKQTNSVNLQLWINELYRLVNEIYLLKLDLLAMHMDQIPPTNEADRVSVATTLRTEIDSLSSKLGAAQSDNPRLNLLRARSAASVGETDKAMEILTRVIKTADVSLREQGKLMAIDILLTLNTTASIDKARAALTAMLVESSSVSPALALAAFRYNLINNATGTGSSFDALDFGSPDDLARSLQKPIATALLTKQKETLGKRYGDYWRLRAEALMLHNAVRSNATSDVPGTELLDAQVQQDLLAGRKEHAVQLLASIEEQAKAKNDAEKAFATGKQRIAVLYALLRDKEKELGIIAATIDARFYVAEQCREVATKYAKHPLAHQLLQQSIQIAQGATSKTDTSQNKRVLDFILQTIEPNVAIFASSASLEPIMQTLAVVLAVEGNYGQLVHVWEKIAQAQSDASQVDAAQVAQRYRAIFKTLQMISEPLSTKSEKGAAKAFVDDDAAIASSCRSLYWSDQIVDPVPEQSGKSSLPWLDSLLELQASLSESGKLIASPSFDKASPLGQYEALFYTSMRQRMIAEYFLNRGVPAPSDLQLAFEKDIESADALLKIISSTLASYHAKSESAVSILIGNAEVGLSRYKAFANAQKSPDMLWYGRLLTATNQVHQREAVNLFTKLVKREKVGTPNWYRIKADVILALKSAGQGENAKKDLDNILELAPDAPDQWKKAVKAIIQR